MGVSREQAYRFEPRLQTYTEEDRPMYAATAVYAVRATVLSRKM